MRKLLSPVRRINKTYKQRGGASVLSCFGMIIEYFSNGVYPLDGFFNNYLKYFDLQIPPTFKIEQIITRHFQDHCYFGELRKLEFVHSFHLENLLNTRGYCRILQWKTSLNTIDMREILDLRSKLKEGGLAMVIYPVSPVAYHCVILGFDKTEMQFFKRDPVKKEIILEDFLLTRPITEYILFGWPR